MLQPISALIRKEELKAYLAASDMREEGMTIPNIIQALDTNADIFDPADGRSVFRSILACWTTSPVVNAMFNNCLRCSSQVGE